MTEDEFLPLFDRYHNMVYKIALVYTGSPPDAEDIVQTVFLKLLEGGSRPFPEHEKAWFAKVAVNACRDFLRRNLRQKTEPLDETIPFSDPEEGELFEAVAALPKKYRLAVHLHYYEGYTCDEIGRLLGISSSAVSMRLHRARKLLRSILKEDINEPAL
ncbi:MAG: sigma-70 family RNA polymerase sigma factor [Oscillospiraceae bacterium]|nr:sigma-70 family RNA polymerase sigma factor [Oscillospiraceae bacterium]